MKIGVLLLFIHVSLLGQASWQDTKPENISYITTKIDSILSEHNFKPENPGISIMVVKDGTVAYKKHIGLSNVETQNPVSDRTIFNIASVSKQFTAFCILNLAEEKKLYLDDSIQKYIPELPYFGKKITLNHLLSNTSGIPEYLEILGLTNQYKNKRLDFDYMLEFYKRYHKLSFSPGERFSYSNAGYMLLCMVIERVSGTDIGQYAEKHIFKPLQMQTARFTKYESDGLPDGTRSYYLKKGKFRTHKPIQPNAMGATGVFCSLDDYRKWDHNFSFPTDDTKHIIAKMKTEYVFNDGQKSGYGAGIILKPYKGFLSEEHSGGWNSFLVQFRRLPELALSIYVASTSAEYLPFKICDQITDVFLPNQNQPNFSNLQADDDLNTFVGTYLDANNVLRSIVIKNDTLAITHYRDSSKVIEKLGYLNTVNDTLIQYIDTASDTVQFVKKDGNIKGFYWKGSTYFRFNRYYNKLDPNDSVFAALAGKYSSEELNFSFSIKNKGKNQWSLKPIFFLNYPLEYIGSNVFKLKDEPIIFRFGKDHVIVGNEWTSNLLLRK